MADDEALLVAELLVVAHLRLAGNLHAEVVLVSSMELLSELLVAGLGDL